MSRIYIGNLPSDVRKEEVEKLFDKYGPIRALDVKLSRDGRGPAYAFLEYQDPRDADDAQRARGSCLWILCRVVLCLTGTVILTMIIAGSPTPCMQTATTLAGPASAWRWRREATSARLRAARRAAPATACGSWACPPQHPGRCDVNSDRWRYRRWTDRMN